MASDPQEQDEGKRKTYLQVMGLRSISAGEIAAAEPGAAGTRECSRSCRRDLPAPKGTDMARTQGAMHRLRSVGKDLKRELKVYRLVLRDERTPRSARFLLGLAVGYTLLPFDLIPDFLPIIGHLDDVIIVPALVSIALKRIPQEVVQDCRSRAGGAETTPRTA